MKAPTKTKDSVDYRESTGTRHCGNCAMFHPTAHACDLVKGCIERDMVCDRWVRVELSRKLSKR